MVKCTINGKEYEVAPGTTIIEAFRQNNIEIAHYCWHPGLSIAGVCRLCMVEIQGNPRLQIGCNTVVTEGMVINNQSEKVKDAVKWGLDFHLINHPLDCPICDQAGECGLQEQYMKYGQYDSEMCERKVKKRKVVDLGERVVLDSERCILCSRCVRFTKEVSKTNELGIFNRGDRSEIGTFKDKPLNNKYSANTIDICPVGALTSKDFRFRQRVWFLKETQSVCPGCATGCNIKVHYNKEGVFRVKPVHNPEINGYWMCDEGRDAYKFVNKEVRLLDARRQKGTQVEWFLPHMAAKKVGEFLRADGQGGGKNVALVLTAQYTVEELESIVSVFKNELGTGRIYYWVNNPDTFDDFDGILNRGDKNPNTKGLLEVLERHNINATWNDLETSLSKGEIKTVVVAGPENQAVYPDMEQKIAAFSKAENLIWLTACSSTKLDQAATVGTVYQIPLKTFIEKDGTFVNFNGVRQTIRCGVTIVPQALTLSEVAELFAGREISLENRAPKVGGRVHNELTGIRGAL